MECEPYPVVKLKSRSKNHALLANLALFCCLLSMAVGKGGVGLTCRMASAPIQVGSHQDITEESFSLFWMLEPRIGMGRGQIWVLRLSQTLNTLP